MKIKINNLIYKSLILVFLSSFISNLTILGFNVLDKVVILIFILLILVLIKINLKFGVFDFLIVLFIFSILISFSLNPINVNSILFSSFLILQIILLYSFRAISRKYNNLISTVMNFIYLFTFIIGIFAILEYFNIEGVNSFLSFFREKNYEYDRISSIFDNPNHLGVFSAIFTLFAFDKLINKSSKSHIHIALLSINLLSVLLSQSRGALFVLLIGFIVYVLIQKKAGIIKLRKYYHILIFVLLIIPIFLFLNIKVDRLWDSVNAILNWDIALLTGGRSIIWNFAIELIKLKPLFGYGVGNFQQSLSILSGTPYGAHSILISFAVEIGLFGLTVFSILCIFIFISALRSPNKKNAIFITIYSMILFSQLTEMFFYNVTQIIIIFWMIVAILIDRSCEKNILGFEI